MKNNFKGIWLAAFLIAFASVTKTEEMCIRDRYVANVGMFQYSLIGGITVDNIAEKALKYPPFAYGSEEMKKGIENDSVSVPGLGEMNAPEAFSVFTVSLEKPEKPEVIAKTKTGNLVGALVDVYKRQVI